MVPIIAVQLHLKIEFVIFHMASFNKDGLVAILVFVGQLIVLVMLLFAVLITSQVVDAAPDLSPASEQSGLMSMSLESTTQCGFSSPESPCSTRRSTVTLQIASTQSSGMHKLATLLLWSLY